MAKIAICTQDEFLIPNDHDWYRSQVIYEESLLVSALEEYGLEVERVNWANKNINWQKYDLCLIRCIWDYFTRYDEFWSWVENFPKETKLIHNQEILHWNIKKSYLKDLERRGVNIVPLKILEGINQSESEIKEELKNSFCRWDTNKLIIKPLISGGAMDTHLITYDEMDAGSKILQSLENKQTMMISPYQKQVSIEGEWSVIVIAGESTHAVLKVPKKNDFRVQDEHGGRVLSEKAPESLIKFAEDAVSQSPHSLLYARVDCLRGELSDTWQVMELEAIEPELFFRFAPHAAKKMARAISYKI